MSVTPVILPKLGLTMEAGRVVAWHKQVGDMVQAGDVLFEVETDKATMEVPSPVSGVLRSILIPADTTAPVTEVVALIADSADEPIGSSSGRPVSPPQANSPPPMASVVSGRTSAAQLPASQPQHAPTPNGRVAASPAARKRAQELGVDINSIKPTKGSRISIEDVEGAAAGGAGEMRQPLSRMRRAIAEQMSRSAREVPQFSVSRDVDMSAASELRKRMDVSYTDVLVGATARTLAAHPSLRSRLEGDALVRSDGVHIGLAVAVEDGLLVPVIRDADRKDLAMLKRERIALEEGARSGKLAAGALSDAVFSISNLGLLGVDRFTALVNPPEAAILAVGRVRDQVVARDGSPAVRPVLTLTLSVDHRVTDGAEASRFLADLAVRLERGEL